nr:YkgJ family cysteine cluster protein [Rhodospirillales bacterium]
MKKKFSKNKAYSKEELEDSLELDYLVEPSVLETFVDYCKKVLANGTHGESVRKMNTEIVTGADNVWLGIKSDAPDFDCRKGCSWCCHQSVSVTWPELLIILDYLRQNLEPTQIDALKKRSKKKADEILEKLNNELNGPFHKIPCLFLEDDICTIHVGRPLQCRGGFSEEESYCKNLFEDTENTQKAVESGLLRGKFLIIPKLIYNSAQVAMTYAMKDFGMKGSTYELTLAISILIIKLCDGEADTIVENDLKPALLTQNLKV